MAEIRRDGEDSATSERPSAELLKQLSDQTVTLVRQELDLAKAELAVKGKKAGLGAGMFAGAGVLGLYAVGALTACLILVLSTAMDSWLAALIIAVVYGAIAGGLALTGKNKVQEGVPPVPEQAGRSAGPTSSEPRERRRPCSDQRSPSARRARASDQGNEKMHKAHVQRSFELKSR